MKVRYDPEADILYILIKDGKVKDTEEVDDDIFIEFGENGEIMGIEIWQAGKHIVSEILKVVEIAKR
ncbi:MULTISPECIES: DUF2283 domain-containing protein [unclassified Archaeoglobus]|jgi:uncharacterized protein YuzE|uniref:DUF2283 domain-containing protein n=1 Tax=unclassified Archaeoglobus TaxID=2643606 RepID=UPI0025C0642F|nr:MULTISPECIES: DUF2283 domain-containing protein [unclassified Archaeoglobus]